MRYKNATINPKNIDDRCFQHGFALAQHHKQIKIHPKQESILNHFSIYTGVYI